MQVSVAGDVTLLPGLSLAVPGVRSVGRAEVCGVQTFFHRTVIIVHGPEDAFEMPSSGVLVLRSPRHYWNFIGGWR
jgi:hypothetical protein